METFRRASLKTKLAGLLALIGTIIMVSFSGMLFEGVDAEEIMVIQSLPGNLVCHTTPGSFKWQGFGKVTKYPKRAIYLFDPQTDDDTQPIDIRFNEGGEAEVRGSIQWEMPLDCPNILELHQRFGTPQAIESQLIEVVTDKSIYMTGPLLSSAESYAEKRTSMISWVDDQIQRGIYATTQSDVRRIDPVTGEETTVTVVEILTDDLNNPRRQETAQLTAFGIRAFNFSVAGIDYSDAVEQQIQTQQRNIMQVQTAIAEAREAEQRTLTIEQQGLATAAEAKWRQEGTNATLVAQAEGRRNAALLDREAAAAEREAAILRGQGNAEARRLQNQADGQLAQRLDALVKIHQFYAEALKGSPVVPQVVMGQNGNGGGSALDMINLLTAELARQVGASAATNGGG